MSDGYFCEECGGIKQVSQYHFGATVFLCASCARELTRNEEAPHLGSSEGRPSGRLSPSASPTSGQEKPDEKNEVV